MNLPFLAAALVLTGYLCGSLPFGYWAGLLKGLDIRKHGSGNIGATNVVRVCGKGIGIPVFALDILKGLLPVLLARHMLQDAAISDGWKSALIIFTGLAAILGHMFTPWLGFKGGKGVATGAGVLLGVAPVSMLAGLVVWAILMAATRYVSLSSMLAAAAVPVCMTALMTRSGEWDWVLLGFAILLAILVAVRHRANIQRLIAGTEPRAGAKPHDMKPKEPGTN